MAHEAIIRVGDTSSEAMIEKASFVMDLMETRLHGLGADWSEVTAVDIYTDPCSGENPPGRDSEKDRFCGGSWRPLVFQPTADRRD